MPTRLTDAGLRATFSAIPADKKLDRADVANLVRSAKDGGRVSATEKRDLQKLLTNEASRFEPSAKAALESFLGIAATPVARGTPEVSSGRSLFPLGIPTASLSDRARQIAEELDKSSLIQRSSGASKNDGRVDAQEIRSALANIDQLDAETASAVRELAQALGVEVGAPVERKWADRTTEVFDWPVSAGTMGSKAVILDGSSSEEYPLLRTYDPATDQWGKIDLPLGWREGTRNMRVAPDNGGMFLMASNGSNGRPIGDAARYDQNTRAVTALPENPKPLSHSAYASAGGNLYALGGGPSAYDQNPKSTAMVFEKASGKWKELPPLPVPRVGASAIEVGGKVVVVGGHTQGGLNLDRVDIYDPATRKWQDPPLRVGVATGQPSLWAEGNQLHVAGGVAANGHANTNHEILDLTTGKISDGINLPAGSARPFATRVGDRVFAFGQENTGNDRTPFTREWASTRPPAPTVVNNTTVSNTFNLNVVNVDLTLVNNTVNNFTNLTAINVTKNVTINDTRLSLAPVVLKGLPVQAQGAGQGCFDPDNDFFIRTSQDNTPLLRQGKDSAGQRYLVGGSHDGKSAAPRNRQDLFAYHPKSKTLIPFKSDAQGQFAIPIPPGLKGELRIFQMKDGPPSGAGTFSITD